MFKTALPKISGVAKEARKNIGVCVKEGEVLAILESREMADIKANYLAAKEKEAWLLRWLALVGQDFKKNK